VAGEEKSGEYACFCLKVVGIGRGVECDSIVNQA